MNKEQAEKTENKESAIWKDKLTKKLKQFKKTRWFPLSVALLIIGLGIIFAFLLGFRITYAPALENSWDAISGVAAWFGVFASVASAIASFMAVRYAIRVADKQNQIALFEKRYECWTEIQNLWACARWIKETGTNQGIYLGFRIYFSETKKIITEDEEPIGFALQFNREQEIVSTGIFLFSYYDAELLKKIISVGFNLIIEVSEHLSEKEENNISEKAETLMNEFYNLCEKYVNTYLEKMQQELQLNNS